MKSFIITISIILAVIAASMEQGYYLLVSQASGTVDCERDEWGFRIENPQSQVEVGETTEGEIPVSFIAFVQKLYESPSQEKMALIEKAIVTGAENLSHMEQDWQFKWFRMNQQLRAQTAGLSILLDTEEIKAWSGLEEIELNQACARSNRHFGGFQKEEDSSQSTVGEAHK